jgi:lipoate-protein ligase A
VSAQNTANAQRKNSSLRFHWNRHHDPELDLAFDEVLLTNAAAGHAGLHVYSWEMPTAVLGYNQSLDDVNPRVVDALDLRVVRRASGGTGIIHDRDIGVSLALPLSHPKASGIRQLYRSFGVGISRGLWALGVPGETVPYENEQTSPHSAICFLTHGNDSVLLHGKKVFGSAQIRRSRAVLIHGTLLLEPDLDLYEAVFRVPRQEIAALVTGARALTGNRTPVVGVLATSIADVFGFTLATPESRRSDKANSSASSLITRRRGDEYAD